jgi:HPt (histidine-containing phosphotransfer) domain-containing protein
MNNPIVIDREGALSRLDGDEELWMEIRQIWLEDVAEMELAVLKALDSQDADQLRRAAHALKGSSGNVGAAQVAELAKFLEHEAPQAQWSSLADGVTRLKQAILDARKALEVASA